MEFSAKPASRILVNTGGSMGGVGASTGLAPSFTLGCGTWGGSSVSENVSPMHLINVKRVAYGIIDATRLAELDPTFNHPEIGGGAPAPAAAPAPAYIGYSPTCGACAPFTPVGIENAPSPQQLQGAYESAAPVAPAPAAAPAVDDKPIDTAQLNAMIDSMVKALKGE